MVTGRACRVQEDVSAASDCAMPWGRKHGLGVEQFPPRRQEEAKGTFLHTCYFQGKKKKETRETKH